MTAIQLKGEQWKQLALLNLTQLIKGLESVTGNTEGGESGMSDEFLAKIDTHLAEMRLYLRSWRASKIVVPAPAVVTQTANGADVPRQKRKYTKRQQPAQAA